MKLRIEYTGWDAEDALDGEAQALLDFPHRLAQSDRLREVDEVLASVDDYGVVRSEIRLAPPSTLFLQAGDGWDRVLLTAASGRVHEWTWRPAETPEQLYALLDGRGIERTTYLGSRRLATALVVDEQTLTATGAVCRPLRRLPTRRQYDAPAL